MRKISNLVVLCMLLSMLTTIPAFAGSAVSFTDDFENATTSQAKWSQTVTYESESGNKVGKFAQTGTSAILTKMVGSNNFGDYEFESKIKFGTLAKSAIAFDSDASNASYLVMIRPADATHLQVWRNGTSNTCTVPTGNITGNSMLVNTWYNIKVKVDYNAPVAGKIKYTIWITDATNSTFTGVTPITQSDSGTVLELDAFGATNKYIVTRGYGGDIWLDDVKVTELDVVSTDSVEITTAPPSTMTVGDDDVAMAASVLPEGAKAPTFVVTEGSDCATVVSGKLRPLKAGTITLKATSGGVDSTPVSVTINAATIPFKLFDSENATANPFLQGASRTTGLNNWGGHYGTYAYNFPYSDNIATGEKVLKHSWTTPTASWEFFGFTNYTHTSAVGNMAYSVLKSSSNLVFKTKVFIPSAVIANTFSMSFGNATASLDMTSYIPGWYTVTLVPTSDSGTGQWAHSMTGVTSAGYVLYDDIEIVQGNGTETNAITLLEMDPNIEFVSVVSVTNVVAPATLASGDADATITGTVNPANATKPYIKWSVHPDDVAKATIVNNKLHAIKAGTVRVKGTADGVDSDYVSVQILGINLPYTISNMDTKPNVFQSWPLQTGLSTVTDDTNSNNKVLKLSWNALAVASNNTLYTPDVTSYVLSNNYSRIAAKVYISSGQEITYIDYSFGTNNGGASIASAKITLPTGYVGGWYTITSGSIAEGATGNELRIGVAGIKGTGYVYFDDLKIIQGAQGDIASVIEPTAEVVSCLIQDIDGNDVTNTGFASGDLTIATELKNVNADIAVPVKVMAAIYKDDKLVQIVSSSNTEAVPKDETTHSYPIYLNIPEGTGYKIKILTWNSTNGLKPYTAAKVVNQAS